MSRQYGVSQESETPTLSAGRRVRRTVRFVQLLLPGATVSAWLLALPRYGSSILEQPASPLYRSRAQTEIEGQTRQAGARL